MTISIGCVALILTMLMFTQFKTVDETDIMAIETMRETELRSELANWKEKYEAVDLELQEREQRISEYKNELNNGANSAELLTAEVKEAETYLGYTDVHGQGIKITLTGYDIHDVKYDHILELINELKNAGAEAISINDNRIINLADIVEISDGLIVMYGNVRLSSPYTIKAIGDSKYLMSTLSMKNSGYIDKIEANGMKIEVEQKNNLEIRAYPEEIQSRYLKGGE